MVLGKGLHVSTIVKKNCKTMNIIQPLKDYCYQTTLHGWSYVVGEDGFLKKTIWLMVIIVFFIRGSFWFGDQYNEYSMVRQNIIHVLGKD